EVALDPGAIGLGVGYEEVVDRYLGHPCPQSSESEAAVTGSDSLRRSITRILQNLLVRRVVKTNDLFAFRPPERRSAVPFEEDGRGATLHSALLLPTIPDCPQRHCSNGRPSSDVYAGNARMLPPGLYHPTVMRPPSAGRSDGSLWMCAQ